VNQACNGGIEPRIKIGKVSDADQIMNWPKSSIKIQGQQECYGSYKADTNMLDPHCLESLSQALYA